MWGVGTRLSLFFQESLLKIKLWKVWEVYAVSVPQHIFHSGYGPAGYALFVAVYALFVAVYARLEILAIPAIPLTMSARLLFGSITGTIIVSICGTVAASVAFLIARYLPAIVFLNWWKETKNFLQLTRQLEKMVLELLHFSV